MNSKFIHKENIFRERIISSAIILFNKKGYLSTNMTDIAEAANTNKTTIYNYFNSKAAILYETAYRKQQQLLDLARPILYSTIPTEQKLYKLLICHIEWRARNSGLAALGQQERQYLPPEMLRSYIKYRDEYEDIFRRILKDIINSRESADVNVNLTIKLILGLLNSIIQWFQPTGEFSSREIADYVWKFVAKALDINPDDPTIVKGTRKNRSSVF